MAIKDIKKNKAELFFVVMILIYVVLFIFKSNYITTAFMDTALMFTKILPILIIVFLFSVIIDNYLSKELIEKYLGKNSSKKGWVYAVVSSIIVAGPPYLLYPLLGDLKSKGVKNSYLAIFLYNRNVKIPFIPVMIYYFGIVYTVIISVLMIIFSIISGLLFEVKYFKKL